MTETQERFLRAVAERVAADRVAEVHLFPSLRQGQQESGVAVVAIELAPPEPPPADDPAAVLEGAAGGGAANEGAAAGGAEADVPGGDDESPEPPATGADAAVDGERADAAPLPVAPSPGDEACDPTEAAAGVSPAGGPGDPMPTIERAADAVPPADAAPAAVPDESGAAEGSAARTIAERPAPPPRHTIVTAHYRLTIKGPDRGRWELSVAEEADAPLITLEAVVRGVRHRASEGADAERLSGDEFRTVAAGGLLR